ncbi:Uncharacterized protein SCF082_LOCUS24574, partial [Durusdinium trenchii]
MRADATYVRACVRLGCPVDQQILDALGEGVLMLDLRLSSPEAVSLACGTLREKPSGIHQIVLRDGMLCFGGDPAYRKYVLTVERRKGAAMRGRWQSSLRLLMTALAVYMQVRGSKVQILDLAGLPLGKELSSLLAPLVATLRDVAPRAPARQLRWLNLSGCGVGDRGLALLLPCLAVASNALPQLEALLLAQNRLSDLHLLHHLLLRRTELSCSGRAAPLRLLDLSKNPGLTEWSKSSRAGKGAGLVLALARLLAEGLPLQVLRLKEMQLTDEDLLPLLKLFQTEANSLSSGQRLYLEDLDLSGNRTISPSVSATLSDALQLLLVLRAQPELRWRLQMPERAEKEEVPRRPRALSEGEEEMTEPWQLAGREALSEMGVEDSVHELQREELQLDFLQSRGVQRSGDEVAADEIVLGSSELWIRQMLLEELQILEPLKQEDGKEEKEGKEAHVAVTATADSFPSDHRATGSSKCLENSFKRSILEDVLMRPPPVAELEGVEGVGLELGRGSMAKVPWKGEFFNSRMDELCQSFWADSSAGDAPVTHGRDWPVSALTKGRRVSPSPSPALDDMHREALACLQQMMFARK